MEIRFDMAGAIRKTAALRLVPRAALKQLQKWGAKTVEVLKREAADMKSTPGRKTGQLARAVGMKMDGAERTLTIGTNVARQTDVKYAAIQDTGGPIKAKNKKYLTIPFPGVKGRAADYQGAGSFILKSKSGNLLIVAPTYRKTRVAGGGYRGSGYKATGGLKALFLLKKEVYIPATRWFSGPTQMMEAILPQYMGEAEVYAEAERMTGMGGGGGEA
jgi:hypothetical protein